MSWPLLLGVVLVLGLSLFASASRRADLARMARLVRDRERAVEEGSASAQLQHPVIDLSRCLGCGTCVDVCPEDGVLELVHGQAMVVNGARCMGISACERECPVDAITVTLANVETREDVPVLTEDLEAVGSPGLFLAGEVTAHALIKTAIEHGTAVAAEVAGRVQRDGVEDDVLDLCIVGAGPAGLACSLEAKRQGLRFATLEQEAATGGTVIKYPRRKLVLAEPVKLPLYGWLKRRAYTKEDLLELWQQVACEQELPIAHGEVFAGLERDETGHYTVRTATGAYVARHVCLAIGRRGVPRRLDVPGEELPNVTYSLIDANSYQQRRVLVVGGGDSAVEAAVGLAEQPGTRVTLAHRRESMPTLRSENRRRLQEHAGNGLQVLPSSRVLEIRPDGVDVAVRNGRGDRTVTVPADDVFVMAGGVAPFELLQRSGVSFDPSLRPPPRPLVEQGTGLTRALAAGFGLSLLALGFAVVHSDYYLLPIAERATHPNHVWLRPGMGVGLWLGIASVVLIAINLLYLVRRSSRIRFDFGSLRMWMTSHVATGILALLCAILHGAMSPRDTPGGHAFWALAVLLVTGAIGRYFYAYVPRAANGRELELAEVKAQLGHTSEKWGQGQREFGEHARSEVIALVEARQWRGSFFGRLLALFGVQRDLRRVSAALAQHGRAKGIAEEQIRHTLQLARRAHRTALMAAHYEDLRAVLSSWRYLHRWVAALLVLLIIVHVVHALYYGAFMFEGGAQ